MKQPLISHRASRVTLKLGLIVFFCGFLLVNFVVLAASGDLDTTFNGTGRVTTPIGNGNEVAWAVAIQSDGKIVAAGDTFGPTRDFAVVRYNADGTLDTSFDGDGKTTTDFNNSGDAGYAVALQADSKIILVGNTVTTGADFALARYNTNGSLDGTFGTGGKVTTDVLGVSSDTAYAVAVQADGKIVAGGIADNSGGSHSQVAVVRYNQNGSVDSTFGNNGRVAFTFGPDINIADAIVIQPDGKIVVGGHSSAATGDFALARLNTEGSLDTSFDGDGKVTADFGSTRDQAYALARQSDGKLIAAGYASDGTPRFALARFNVNGSLDATFDGDGKVTTDFGGIEQYAFGTAVQADGKIVAGGYMGDGPTYSFAIARYTANGAPDPTFGNAGKVTFNVNNSGNGQAIAIQPDWKIVVAGSAFNGTNVDFAVARLLAESVQFTQTTYSADEASGAATITVTRAGDISNAATVNYATSDSAGLQSCATVNTKASERCDYVTSVGTVRFAANELSKTITIPLIDDATVEGNETFTITLSSPTGVPLGTPASATISILDNDVTSLTSNPIDGVEFFVRQQYLDILGRQPDQQGFQNWVNTLANCPNGGFGEPPTSNCDRLHVAAGFFQSDEFLNRGYWVFRLYMVSFQQRPSYAQFIPDMAQVGGPKSPAEEETSKAAFVDAFVQRPEFLARYAGLNGQALANALTTNAGLPSFTVTGGMTNGQILRAIAERQTTLDKFLTEGTVSILYFGFQRRDPDTIGYQNNVDTLNANPNNLRHMIFIFIYSTEYRQRFGPA